MVRRGVERGKRKCRDRVKRKRGGERVPLKACRASGVFKWNVSSIDCRIFKFVSPSRLAVYNIFDQCLSPLSLFFLPPLYFVSFPPLLFLTYFNIAHSLRFGRGQDHKVSRDKLPVRQFYNIFQTSFYIIT